jgi:DNA-directed RNA polymerase specialized sigma24 family protein
MTALGIEHTVDRRRLINVAYRLLGTMADAEDVV